MPATSEPANVECGGSAAFSSEEFGCGDAAGDQAHECAIKYVNDRQGDLARIVF
jgi:hypothetical protein